MPYNIPPNPNNPFQQPRQDNPFRRYTPQPGGLVTPPPPPPPDPRAGFENAFKGSAKAAEEQGRYFLRPEAVANETNQLYKLMASSPAFASMLQGIMGQGSQFNTAFQGNLARTGLSGTGVGAISGGLAKGVTGNQIGQARGQLFSEALNTAIQNLTERYRNLVPGTQAVYQRQGQGFQPGKILQGPGQAYLGRG